MCQTFVLGIRGMSGPKQTAILELIFQWRETDGKQ